MTCSFQIPGTQIRIIIESCDLLKQRGVKIIHSSSTFDTDSKIVNPNSLFGVFLNKHQEYLHDIDLQIDSFCDHIGNHGSFDSGLPYRKRRFKRGTVCPIHIDLCDVCLASFCDSSILLHADHITINDYLEYWTNLWKSLANISIPKKEISVAVPGGNILSVGSGFFSLDQKIAVIVHSFCRSVTSGCPFQTLRICIHQEDSSFLDWAGWQNSILPFLYQMANVPILWHGEVLETLPVPLTGVYENSNTIISVKQSFLTDVLEIISNLASSNGSYFEQFDGNKKNHFHINVNADALEKYLINLQSNDSLVWEYLCQKKGSRYDRSRLFQLLGVLQERSTFFGDLNRKSVVIIGLKVTEGEIPSRWEYIGSDVDNVVSYVGQILSELKRVHPNIYTLLVDLIPGQYRK